MDTSQKIEQAKLEFIRNIIIDEVDSFLSGGGSGDRTLNNIRDNAIASMGFACFSFFVIKE